MADDDDRETPGRDSDPGSEPPPNKDQSPFDTPTLDDVTGNDQSPDRWTMQIPGDSER